MIIMEMVISKRAFSLVRSHRMPDLGSILKMGHILFFIAVFDTRIYEYQARTQQGLISVSYSTTKYEASCILRVTYVHSCCCSVRKKLSTDSSVVYGNIVRVLVSLLNHVVST